MRLWENYRWLIPDKEVPVGSANYAFMSSATFIALLLLIMIIILIDYIGRRRLL